MGWHLLLPANGKRHLRKLVSDAGAEVWELSLVPVLMYLCLTLLFLRWDPLFLQSLPSHGRKSEQAFLLYATRRFSSISLSTCTTAEGNLFWLVSVRTLLRIPGSRCPHPFIHKFATVFTFLFTFHQKPTPQQGSALKFKCLTISLAPGNVWGKLVLSKFFSVIRLSSFRTRKRVSLFLVGGKSPQFPWDPPARALAGKMLPSLRWER